jgi:hypothetical protein
VSSSKTVNLENANVMIVMPRADLADLIRQTVDEALASSSAQPKLMSAQEIGQELRVSADLVRRWAREGDGRPSGEICPHIRIGKKKLLFRLDAVIEWAESAKS